MPYVADEIQNAYDKQQYEEVVELGEFRPLAETVSHDLYFLALKVFKGCGGVYGCGVW